MMELILKHSESMVVLLESVLEINAISTRCLMLISEQLIIRSNSASDSIGSLLLNPMTLLFHFQKLVILDNLHLHLFTTFNI